MDSAEMSANPTPRKRGRKSENELQALGPPLPRTRSKVALDWSTSELLILVNEISAVEDDCFRALSSYQKWKMVVDNCTILGLRRTLNQCKNKCSSLLAEFNQIKHWDSRSTSDSYWDLDSERRKEFQLPENFDKDLFKAIDNCIRTQQDDSDIDPDTANAEGENDLLDVIATLGSKKQRRQSVSHKIEPEEESQNTCLSEQPQELQTEVGHKNCEEVNPLMFSESETQVQYGEQELLGSRLEENEEPNTQMCLDSESLQVHNAEQEPQESHLNKNEEANPQMFLQRENPRVQCEQEPRGSCLDKNEEINPQMYSESETPQVQCGEQETQRSHLQEIEKVNNVMYTEKEIPHVKYTEQEPRERNLDEKPQESLRNGNCPRTINVEVERQKSPKEKSRKITRPRTKKTMGKKEEEHLMVQNLRQNAKTILDVVQGIPPERAEYGAINTKSAQDVQVEFARQQGDSLIACLGNIVSVLDKFPYLIQESN